MVAPTVGRRLLVIADSAIPVPPPKYGGTERVLGYLLDGLAARGYQITLMGAAGSRPPGRLVSFSDARLHPRWRRGVAKGLFWAKLARELPRHDVIHSVARLDYVRPALRHPIPKVLHFHTQVFPDQISFIRRHGRGPLVLSAAGAAMIREHTGWGTWRPVHNGIPLGRYRFEPRPETPPYLLFLGKLLPGKNAHVAIAVARRAGMRLVIAGNLAETDQDVTYFEREVRPHLSAGMVDYVGEQDDAGTMRLLGGATALIHPTSLPETFGLVVVEALACGTPAIVAPSGELPFIVRHGVTGFVCGSTDEMVAAVEHVATLDRAACRAEAEHRFDTATMVEKFDEVYSWLLDGGTAPVPAAWSTP